MGLNITRTAEDDAGGAPLDLAAAIGEFYREFPQRRADTFILDHGAFADGHAAVASFAAALQDLRARHPLAQAGVAKSLAAGLFEGQLPASVQISEAMFNGRSDSAVYGRFVIPAGPSFSARLLKSLFVAQDPLDNADFPVMPPAFNNTEMWQRYVLDHELGHALTIHAYDKQAMKETSFSHHAECAADAYAMIRHFQRYGDDSLFPAFIRDMRGLNAIHKGDVEHYTSHALSVVIDINKKGRLAFLSPQACVDLAGDIANRTALSVDAEHNLQKAVAATRAISAPVLRNRNATSAQKAARIMDTMEKVCAIGATTPSPTVLNACRRYMATVGRYVPAGLRQTKSADELRAMRDNLGAMKNRPLPPEPAATGLGRVFRDALLDAQSGKPRPPSPGQNSKKPRPPKS